MKKLLTLTIVLSALLLAVPSMAVTWNVGLDGDFATIQEAIDSIDPVVQPGDTILVGPGNHAGATVTKAVEIKGEDGATINSGPLPWTSRTFMAGFLFPGDGAGSGATISHLTFETVEFPVFSRGANDVTVEHCTMRNPIQGVSDWRGCGWQISHNQIIDLRTANGGGIAILIGDYMATPGGITDNVVSHNKITGTLHVAPNDGGGYNGTGVVLYADFRWGMPGAVAIEDNRVVKNKISLTSDTPTVVDVVAIELTDTRNAPMDVVVENAIGFNDLRGTVVQIALTPEALDTVNKISRNLGDNRGQGLHPSAFGPGGN